MPRATSAAAEYKFSNPHGYDLLRSILRPHLKYEPHDYQLEGVAKSLDGVHLVAVLATGAGKTAYFAMYMLVLQELSKNPNLCNPPKKVPKDPAMVVVYPTVNLEEEMQTTFQSLGLTTIVINNRTTQAARLRKENIWTSARSNIAMILLSPEMLTRKACNQLLQVAAFTTRIMALGVDEIHLLISWGAFFRPLFTHIGFAHARLPPRTVLILTTATLVAGPPTQSIFRFFGLKDGQFHLIRRSNLRPEMQVLVRILNKGMGGYSFPDFQFVLESRRKTIIFCTTIKVGDCLMRYLRKHVPSGSSEPTRTIRLYNSLFWPEYNADTLALFRNTGECRVIIATDVLMVGVDIPDVDDVVLANGAGAPDELFQKIGRAGRNRALVSEPRGIVFFTKKQAKTARQIIDGNMPKKSKGGKGAAPMDPGIARILIAAVNGECITAAQDNIYDNPPFDPICSPSCLSCTANPAPSRGPCKCSGCQPEDLPMASLLRPASKKNPVKQRDRLKKPMRAYGNRRLLKLRERLCDASSPAEKAVIPPFAYLPDATIKLILDRFALIRSQADLDALLVDRTYAARHSFSIWEEMRHLRIVFDKMRTGGQVQLSDQDELSCGDGSDVSVDEGSDEEAERDPVVDVRALGTLESTQHVNTEEIRTGREEPVVDVRAAGTSEETQAGADSGDKSEMYSTNNGSTSHCFVGEFRLSWAAPSTSKGKRKRGGSTASQCGPPSKRQANRENKENMGL